MITHEPFRNEGILIVRPSKPLTSEDFQALSAEVDPVIEETGDLRGLMIDAPTFPGWEDVAALISHFRFIRDHQQHIERVAAVTDSSFLAILPKVSEHFIQAEVRHFPADESDAALAWLREA